MKKIINLLGKSNKQVSVKAAKLQAQKSKIKAATSGCGSGSCDGRSGCGTVSCDGRAGCSGCSGGDSDC